MGIHCSNVRFYREFREYFHNTPSGKMCAGMNFLNAFIIVFKTQNQTCVDDFSFYLFIYLFIYFLLLFFVGVRRGYRCINYISILTGVVHTVSFKNKNITSLQASLLEVLYSVITDLFEVKIMIYSQQMSHLVRKPTICICENKDADQLRGNREADHAFAFATRIVHFLFFLNPKFQVSSLLL